MAWRQFGWISLFVLILMAACGAPTVTDINGGGSGIADDDDAGTGDDDDDGASPTIPPTTPPAGAPTLTNVPSFATWNLQIRPLLCPQCHTGSAGGFLYFASTTQSDLRYFWFESICNRDNGALNEGTQSYSPPTGRFPSYMRGNDVGPDGVAGTADDHDGNIGTNNAGTIDDWMAEGGATVPPSCNDLYDLANSN